MVEPRTGADAGASGATAARSTWGMVGQQHAVAALRSALEHDRLAHAYLFTGPRGVGRATLARRLAQALSCEAPDGVDPCLACRACHQVEAEAWPDYHAVRVGGICDETDHRDHGADGSTRIRICQVRRIARQSAMPQWSAGGPSAGALAFDLGEAAPPARNRPRRMFLIDAAEDLQTEAAHALLKTLEEPPRDTHLILVASTGEVLPRTIRSRVVRYRIAPAPEAEIAEKLAADGLAADDAWLASVLGGTSAESAASWAEVDLQAARELLGALESMPGASASSLLDFAEGFRGAEVRERVDLLIAVYRALARREAERAAGAGDTRVLERWLDRFEAAERARRELWRRNLNPQLVVEGLLLELRA